ncbi:MAG TPA: hypothetical protein VD838_13800, partial [Anaeromyxobacteraceae bacterium]|nr:hypothetical protein [Anaeromyxobacteraceae bacterium]
MGRIVVQRYTNGPIKAVLEAEASRLELFSKRERNALLARSLERALHAWRAVYMRIRFMKPVTESPFHYQGDPRSPMFESGEMKEAAYKGRIIARSPGGRVRGTVGVPFGHAVTPEISRVWKVLPPNEVTFVAVRFAKHVAREIDESEQVPVKRPKVDAQPRRRLT